jgi:hypothetical protein
LRHPSTRLQVSNFGQKVGKESGEESGEKGDKEEVMPDEAQESGQTNPEYKTELDTVTGINDKCVQGKVALAKDACDSAAKHYDDYYRSFASLDGKAQATATISGLVLAAMAAFVKDGRVSALVHSGHWWILMPLAPPVFSLASVIMSLVGAKVTEIVVPFDSPEQIREAKNLAKLPCTEFSQEHVLDYYRARLEHWIQAVESIAKAVESKASWILRGQIAMIAALVALLALYIVVLLKS